MAPPRKPYTRPIVGTSVTDGTEIHFAKLKDVRKKGFWPGAVCMCAQGKKGHVTHKGYRWRYATPAAGEVAA